MCERDQTEVLNITNAKGEPRTIDVDSCIASIVKALNACGVVTIASCCGHGIRPGNIALADGRELVIAPDYETGRLIDRMFPSLTGE